MKRTNLVNKSVKLLMSIIIASSIVAMGSNGTVAATLTNNDAIISNIVMAAESTPLPKQWSTAEVYKDARYGDTWSGEKVGGSYTRWSWLNDKQYCFTVEHVTANNGTVLEWQQLLPVDMTQGGPKDTYYGFTDNNEPIRKYFCVWKDNTLISGEHLWNNVEKMFASDVASNRVEIGNTHLQVQDDENFYRLTYNVTDAYEKSTLKGYITYIEVKKTGEVYGFRYSEDIVSYDNNRALTVIYSCLPTLQK